VLPEGLPDAPTNRTELLHRALPFILTMALALGLVAIGPGASLDGGLATVALGGFVLTGVLILTAPLRHLPDWFPLLPAGVFCTSVGVLRHAVGHEASELAVLLLLAVGWQALYARRSDLVATIAMAGAVMVVPLVVVGPPQYPESGWRGVLILVAVATVVGSVVQRLVGTVRQERNLLRGLADIARTDADDPDLGDRICASARALVDADLAVLFAPTDEGVVAIAGSGVELAPGPLPPEDVPLSIRDALDSAILVEMPDVRTVFGADAERSERLGVRAWAHQPTVPRTGVASGVLSVAWREPGRRMTEQERTALLLLASEAAKALERAELIARLAAEASHDPLTGLANRRTWDEVVTREIARAGRSGSTLSVALLDLDHFKAFNDAHGHLAGDDLLRKAAVRWQSRLRAGDLLARWGGEEFAVLMPDTTTASAVGIVQRLLDATPGDQTFSAGVVTTTGQPDLAELMAEADAALYRAKAGGRNRVEAVAPIVTAPASDGPSPPTGAALRRRQPSDVRTGPSSPSSGAGSGDRFGG
jgi:diguanylate cyclase (GGDEF)-like protein